MQKLSFLIAFLLFSGLVRAQADSALYGPQPADGIYLSYWDFRRNHSIAAERIVSDLDREQLEFIGKVLAADSFAYRDGNRILKHKSAEAWGFFQNGTLYLNYGGAFYRVPVFGAISYLVVRVRVNHPGFYDPRFGYPVGSGSSVELREFLMNYYDGRVEELSFEKVNALLERDQELMSTFRKLSRRKQREQIYRYIRLYNERHPVHYLR